MKWYSTTDSESALQALALIYPHVVLRRIYANARRIPLRLRKVTGVDWFFYSPAHRLAAQSQLELWRAGRGILVNTHKTASLAHPIGPHDALLLPECPTSLYRIEAESRDTQQVGVIYKPPTWRYHEETLRLHCPTVEDCQRVYNWLQTNTGYISDAQLKVATDLHSGPGSMRYLFYKYAGLKPCVALVPIRLRYKPDDPVQKEFYNWLGNYPIATGNGYRHVPETDLIAYSHTWRALLRAMKKEAVIEKQELIHQYLFHEHSRPNWAIMSRQYRTLQGEFQRVQALVHDAPEFPHLEILSRQSGAESI